MVVNPWNPCIIMSLETTKFGQNPSRYIEPRRNLRLRKTQYESYWCVRIVHWCESCKYESFVQSPWSFSITSSVRIVLISLCTNRTPLCTNRTMPLHHSHQLFVYESFLYESYLPIHILQYESYFFTVRIVPNTTNFFEPVRIVPPLYESYSIT